MVYRRGSPLIQSVGRPTAGPKAAAPDVGLRSLRGVMAAGGDWLLLVPRRARATDFVGVQVRRVWRATPPLVCAMAELGRALRSGPVNVCCARCATGVMPGAGKRLPLSLECASLAPEWPRRAVECVIRTAERITRAGEVVRVTADLSPCAVEFALLAPAWLQLTMEFVACAAGVAPGALGWL
jgi:hypothetical protein